MGFFIVLSSLTGIVGNPGRSNYAAGNTFQDALARYRVARGEKANALDLGIILGEGFVAENKEIQDKLVRLNMLDTISQDQLFAIFDLFCDPSTQYTTESSSQIVAGLALPSVLQQRGVEVPIAPRRSLFLAMQQINTVGGGDGLSAFDSSSEKVLSNSELSATVRRIFVAAGCQLEGGRGVEDKGIEA